MYELLRVLLCIASLFISLCFSISHTSLTLTLAILKLFQFSLVAAALVAFQFIWFLFCSLCCMALFSFFCLVSLVLFMCMYFIIVCALREHKARSSSGSSGSGRKTPANRSSGTRVFSIRIRCGRSSRLSLGKYKFLCGAHCLPQVEKTVAYLTNEVACVGSFRLHFASATKGEIVSMKTSKKTSYFWVTLPVRNADESVCWHRIVTYAKLAQHQTPLPSVLRPLIVVFCPYNCSFVRVIRTFCCCFMAALLCSPDPDPDPELTRPRLTPTHNLAHSGNILLVKFAQYAG